MMYQKYTGVRVFCEATTTNAVTGAPMNCPENVDLIFYKGRICIDTLIPRLEGVGWTIKREQVGSTKSVMISAICPRHYLPED